MDFKKQYMNNYRHEYLKQFVKEFFLKLGCEVEHAEIISDVFIAAELRDIPSHGLIRLIDYYNLWKSKRINVKPNIKIIHETPSTAVVDGDNAIGMIAAYKSMELAIEKAKVVGTGWVATMGSNHFGIAGYYAMMALKHDMIGITLTNANPLVAPTFSISRLLGTNPIAVAIPAGNYPPFVADFATTPIARGKLAIAEMKGEKVAYGFVQDANGNPSDDPSILKRGGAMVPLGSDYEHGSHKGYCISAIVDIFSGVLSGANFGPFIPPSVAFLEADKEQVGKGTGHFFGAIRIDAFQPADIFKNRMDKWIETFRNAQNIPGNPKVMIPGDPERFAEERNKKEGIKIMPEIEKALKEMAKEMNIEF